MPDEPSDTLPAERSLTSRSFIGYLVMGFLTAVNDNMFRWLIVPIAKHQFGSAAGLTEAQRQANESFVLALGLGSFILPSIIFAPWSGWVADRFSKRTSTVWLKVAEAVIMLVGILAIRLADASRT